MHGVQKDKHPVFTKDIWARNNRMQELKTDNLPSNKRTRIFPSMF